MDLLLLAAAAWALFLAGVAATVGVLYPILRNQFSRFHPRFRVRLLRLVGFAPFGLATLGVLLCFAPKLLANAFARTDHCVQHGDGHAHFCLVHPPELATPAAFWVLLSVAAFALLASAVAQSIRFRSSARALRQLSSTASFDGQCGAWRIESDLPVAITVGVVRTRILVSSGLLRAMPARLIDAVVAHESAHERRRDGLWKPVVELFAHAHLFPVRRVLLDDLEIACEQACDEEAAAELGSRLIVAEALLAMQRLRQGMPGPGVAALAFGDHGVVARVRSLMSDEPGAEWGPGVTAGALLLAGCLAAVSADPLHHLTEVLIHYVLG